MGMLISKGSALGEDVFQGHGTIWELLLAAMKAKVLLFLRVVDRVIAVFSHGLIPVSGAAIDLNCWTQ